MHRTTGLTLLSWCIFIVYGSLVPFELRPLTLAQALQQFAQIPWLNIGLAGRLDWLANLALYIPAGFLGAVWLAGRRISVEGRAGVMARANAAVVALALCAGLALAVEFAQVFIAPRTVSLNDLAAELIGATAGSALAFTLGTEFGKVLAALQQGRAQRRSAWLTLYALGYLTMSLFPFDFSTAGAVFAEKVQAGHAAWWWAPYQNARLGTALLKLVLDVALTIPFGIALALSSRRFTWMGTAGAGLAMGTVIELAQLFLLGATSQGASVITRGLGVTLGALALRSGHSQRLSMTTKRWRWAVAALAVPWLLAAAYLAGLLQNGFLIDGWALRARETRLMPLYYYYFVGEARALTSLLLHSAIYAWPGIAAALCWRQPRTALVAVATGAVCAAVEAGKLFVVGQHPDPTNPLIAMAASWLACTMMTSVMRADPIVPATPTAAKAERALAKTAPAPGQHVDLRPGSGTAQALILALALVGAAHLPFARWPAAWLIAALVAFHLWRHPVSAMLLLPIVIALTDSAAFTGIEWFSLLDLVLVVVVLIGMFHPARRHPPLATGIAQHVLVALGAMAFLPGIAIGLLHSTWPDPHWMISPVGGAHAWLLVKGVVWAVVLAWYARRVQLDASAACVAFGRGMVVALAGVVLLTVVERWAFVGLRDFDSDYRAPGPFTAIALGGAYIECFLAAAAPFAVVLAFQEKSRWLRLGCSALLLASAYATMATFSRGGQVVFLIVVGAAIVLMAVNTHALRAGRGSLKRLLAGGALAVATALVSIPILTSPFGSARFQQLGSDWNSRLSHWSESMGFGAKDWLSLAAGNGLGSFGRESYIQGQAASRPSVFTMHQQAGSTWLTVHAGALSYFDQKVSVRRSEKLTLTARLRTTGGKGISVILCEKDLVQSRECSSADLRVSADGQWHQVSSTTALASVPGTGWPPRPTRLTLFAMAGGPVDVDRISLRSADGRELLRNGDFTDGAQGWLYSSDMHLVWHMKNLWLQLFFELGWLGVAGNALLLLGALVAAYRGATTRSPMWWAFGLALLAFHGVGVIDSVIDTPRFLQLYLSIALLAWTMSGIRHGGVAASVQTREPS